MDRIFEGCEKNRLRWPGSWWPRVAPPWAKKGENTKPEGLKPPSTPPPPTDSSGYDPNVGQPPPVPPVGKASSVIPIVVMREPEAWPFQMISVTMGLAEDRLREIIREEIRKAQEEEADGKG